MSKNEFFNNINKIHFIGIGGISLSALAKLMLNKGIKVSGSDLVSTEITKHLEKLGVEINYSHKKENVKDSSLIVFSGAIKEDNPEVVFANENNILLMERADFLREVAKEYKNVISVAGSHGKTTTTGMIGNIFKTANKQPTVHVGGIVKNFDSNLLIGDNEFFITEACEYNRSFLKLPTTLGVVLNVDDDHPDCYKNIDEIKQAFSVFFDGATDNVVINKDNLDIAGKENKSITFGLTEDCYFTARNIKVNKENKIEFTALKENKRYCKIKLNCYGKHNVYNALAAIAVCDYYGVEKADIQRGLKSFAGIKRRFEYIKKINNAEVFHDYAHHPTEVQATINACKGFNKKIVCIFQPHTYTRTQSLLKEFLTCFKGVDELVLLPTYPAREKEIAEATSKKLYKQVKKVNKFKCKYVKNFNLASKYIYKNSNINQTVLILGAGDIEKLAYKHL